MSLSGKVVVITGATSGIGRAAAIRFAARGCRLVLAGRRMEALLEVALECRANGAHTLIQHADVTSEADVNALAALALAQLGGIDIWVNNAGVTTFGSLEKAALDDHRRVIETNLFGAMHGARAVLPVFRQQHRGVLINVGSILSKIGQPFVPSYVISKFAVRGLTEALRAEVADEYDIHVCSLLPYAVDTEHFESAANHVGKEAHPLPPVQPPEKVARALVELAERPRRELHVPRIAVIGIAAHALFPRTVERILLDALARWHFGPSDEAENHGGLYQPEKTDGKEHGERLPRVSTARLVAYAAKRFAQIQLELSRRKISRRAPLKLGLTLADGSLDAAGGGPHSIEGKVRVVSSTPDPALLKGTDDAHELSIRCRRGGGRPEWPVLGDRAGARRAEGALARG